MDVLTINALLLVLVIRGLIFGSSQINHEIGVVTSCYYH